MIYLIKFINNILNSFNKAKQEKEKEMNKFELIIQRFNKKIVDPENFDQTIEGFQEYLNETGIKFVSAKEMCTPHHPQIASDLGYAAFVPEKGWWVRGAALAALFDHLRAKLGKPITVRNWWRPAEYNAKVGGAKGSDHVGAYAFDMDFKTKKDRQQVEEVLEGFYKDPDLQMSLGLGGYTIHLGLCSEKGNRRWYYDSYKR